MSLENPLKFDFWDCELLFSLENKGKEERVDKKNKN